MVTGQYERGECPAPRMVRECNKITALPPGTWDHVGQYLKDSKMPPPPTSSITSVHTGTGGNVSCCVVPPL